MRRSALRKGTAEAFLDPALRGRVRLLWERLQARSDLASPCFRRSDGSRDREFPDRATVGATEVATGLASHCGCRSDGSRDRVVASDPNRVPVRIISNARNQPGANRVHHHVASRRHDVFLPAQGAIVVTSIQVLASPASPGARAAADVVAFTRCINFDKDSDSPSDTSRCR